ncbi:MAG: hypothetical protein CM1200mP6_05160 [Anaerolineaceae bacterium]|nr:MAG: hypothetical protein CM1200mP6_05160 [Anaerolineaceae bacterium]
MQLVQPPWLEKQLSPGKEIQVSGRVDVYLGKKVISGPDWESVDTQSIHTGRIVPIYHLTKGITAKTMRNWMYRIVNAIADTILDPLPKEMVRDCNCLMLKMLYDVSIFQIHKSNFNLHKDAYLLLNY